MSYQATSRISDENLSKRSKMLYILLAHTMTEINKTPELVSEFRNVIYHLERTQENLMDVKHETSKALAGRINGHLNGGVRDAELNIAQIESDLDLHERRRRYILEQLSADESPWNNRSFVVQVPINQTEYLTWPEVVEGEHQKPAIDNEKVARLAYNDLSQHLNPSKFRLMLLGRYGKESSPGSAVSTAIITFNEADEPHIRAALVDITRKKLTGLAQGFSKRSPESAASLARALPYRFATPVSKNHDGEITLGLLKDSDPLEAISQVEFQEQCVLMNLEEYAQRYDDLRDFIEDDHGGIYGKNDEGLRQVMYRCMEIFQDEKNFGVSMDRLLQSLDREMEASASFEELRP